MRELQGLKRLIAPTAALALFGAVACNGGGKDGDDTDAAVEPTDDDNEDDEDDDNNDDNSNDDQEDQLTAADVRAAIREMCTAAEVCGQLDGSVDDCIDAYESDLPDLFDESNQDCIDAAVAYFSCVAEAGDAACSETDLDTGTVYFGCEDETLYEEAILACFPEETDAQDTWDSGALESGTP